jgi:hypothetical protein
VVLKLWLPQFSHSKLALGRLAVTARFVLIMKYQVWDDNGVAERYDPTWAALFSRGCHANKYISDESDLAVFAAVVKQLVS